MKLLPLVCLVTLAACAGPKGTQVTAEQYKMMEMQQAAERNAAAAGGAAPAAVAPGMAGAPQPGGAPVPLAARADLPPDQAKKRDELDKRRTELQRRKEDEARSAFELEQKRKRVELDQASAVAQGEVTLAAADRDWHLAAEDRERVDKLVILNSPHPAALHRELLGNPAQREAMRYMLFFRSPRAEAALSEDDFRRLSVLFETWEVGGVPLDPAFVAAYKRAWSRPGALATMLNYYRGTQLHPPGPGEPGVEAMTLPPGRWRVDVPTRVIWGERDAALLPSLLDGLDELVPGVDICRIPEGTHWIAHEYPDRVNALIREFI